MKIFSALRKKFVEFKEQFEFHPINRNFEFQADLEDHPIGTQDIYRLYYVNYHRIREYEGCMENNIGVINWCGKPFKLPEGMTREEGFKVLSYLADFIERRPDIAECSWKSVTTLDSVLDLERFGFIRVDENNVNNIIDLFTVDGRLLLFKKMSEHYPRYFNWYVKNVSRYEVVKIYERYGLEFQDIRWLD